MDKVHRKYLIIYLVCAVVIFSVTYYITDRVYLRAKQIAQNKIDVDYHQRGYNYAIGVTGAFSLLYFFFARDMLSDREKFNSED